MTLRLPFSARLIPALLAAAGGAAAASELDCEVASGPATAALVELYTSEGCSSCPPADRQLRDLRQQLPADARVVPVGLHVTYWDAIGWRDPFAQARFDERQRALLAQGRWKVAYTPQFFVDGRELRDWRAGLVQTIQRVNARPALAAIDLHVSAPTRAGLPHLRLEVSARVAAPRGGEALFVALTESGLASRVARGENAGVTLRHDDTARLWLGPIALHSATARLTHELALPAQWRPDRLRALAFVQDADARILQALDTSSCAGAQAGRRQ
ncbi:hypothetical protein B0920_19770 [Massilia sp. KIM]|uniref:DUF1223 domain-containing protein n=1 Tax=Massilia sp. KIM TaxID=1955422 RepID=UPI00098EE576|nr:DUF1223 domain-containing protein [Massilia sp. KIM]OON61160.1 hypothetical protein B0920_19770 [Massilia sp. KIM]